jgi:hypothetical protein
LQRAFHVGITTFMPAQKACQRLVDAARPAGHDRHAALEFLHRLYRVDPPEFRDKLSVSGRDKTVYISRPPGLFLQAPIFTGKAL